MLIKFKVLNSKFKIILISLLTTPVSAHSIGQAPFLKINGQYANLYPVPLTSLYNFLADSFVEVQNSQNSQNNTATNSAITPAPKPKKPSQLPFVLGLGILVIILVTARWFVLGQHRGKHR